MSKFVFVSACAVIMVSIAMVVSTLNASNAAAMNKCLEKFSRATCVHNLR